MLPNIRVSVNADIFFRGKKESVWERGLYRVILTGTYACTLRQLTSVRTGGFAYAKTELTSLRTGGFRFFKSTAHRRDGGRRVYVVSGHTARRLTEHQLKSRPKKFVLLGCEEPNRKIFPRVDPLAGGGSSLDCNGNSVCLWATEIDDADFGKPTLKLWGCIR